jgi:predicted AAA+ superfamily ATPase
MLDELMKLSQNFLKLKDSPYRRYFIQKNPFKHRLSLLLGQRGVGKTTTLIQFLLNHTDQDLYDPSILYIQADHFQLGNVSLYEIAEEFHAMGGEILALDEIHKYPNWSQELKSLYDTFPKLTVVASGSSALRMYQGSHDLARRAIKYNMYGLSFREFLELQLGEVQLPVLSLDDILQNHVKRVPPILDTIEAKGHKILPLFQNYLLHGYYPYFFEMPNEELYFMTLEQNHHTTIESDLAAIYPHLTGSSIHKLKALLIFIAKSVPFTPHWNDIKNLLEIGDARTIKTYFQYLESANLIRTVSKNHNKLSHMHEPEKIYLDNPNQIHALSGGGYNAGTQREIFFLNMLSLEHEVTLPSKGDFLINGKLLFEIGGRKKSFEQIKNVQNSYIASADLENGFGAKIPLWLFGFIY